MPTASLRITTVRGIDVRMAPSWLLVAGAIAWAYQRTLVGDGRTLPAAAAMGLVVAALLTGSVLLHAFARALEATHRGAEVTGIRLFLLGSATDLRDPDRRAMDELAIAAVGPCSTVALAAVFALASMYAGTWGLGAVAAVAGLLGWLNLGLAALNLLPGAPLDGGRGLRAVVWAATGDRRRATVVAARVGVLLGLGMVGVAGWLVAVRTAGWAGLGLVLVAAHVLRAAWMQLGPRRGRRLRGERQPAELPVAAGWEVTPAAAHAQPRAARLVTAVASLALVVWAAVAVPMPFHEVRPGSARPVEDLVVLSTTAGEVRGDLELLTVRRTTPSLLGVAWIGLHPGRDLRPAPSEAPGGLDREAYVEIQRNAFRTSFLTAVAVAAEQAGHTVELGTRAVVAQVLEGGPSDGRLQPGDVITLIDGTPVESADRLVEQLGASDQPRPVALRVDRDGEPTEVTVDLRQLPDSDRPVLGILIDTITAEPVLPFDATLGDTNIVGPSAGLMLALATTDLLLEEDLARGRTIAGTGTIARDGSVGPVGSVELKTRAALAAGAELLLVPAAQVQDARAAVAAGVEVVGVTSLQDALDALRGAHPGVAAARR